MDSIHSKNKEPIKLVKRHVPEHPYCTNWPMTKKEENEVEICVSCGEETSYKKGEDVTFRYGYIDGAGQLCFTCSQRGNYGNSEWTRYG